MTSRTFLMDSCMILFKKSGKPSGLFPSFPGLGIQILLVLDHLNSFLFKSSLRRRINFSDTESTVEFSVPGVSALRSFVFFELPVSYS